MARIDYLGEFEHLILLAILQLGDGAVGRAIREKIESQAERSVSYGAVYATLRRLRRNGMIESRMGSPEPVRGGRAKTHFRLTEHGLTTLRSSQRRITRLSTGLESTLLAEDGD